MDSFESIFQQLKEILAEYANELVVVVDEKNNFYLNTHHIMKNNKPLYFGSTTINKNYVSFHLMPVYVFPELLTTLSPELRKRMQGKSCFNFNRLDSERFNELKSLTQAGYTAFAKAGYLSP